MGNGIPCLLLVVACKGWPVAVLFLLVALPVIAMLRITAVRTKAIELRFKQ
jgi:hypothetical protein